MQIATETVNNCTKRIERNFIQVDSSKQQLIKT